MTKRPSPFAWMALLSALLAASGCGLFTPEEPEPPTSNTGVRLPLLTVSPDSAIYAWEHGIEQRSEQLFLHSLSDSTTIADVSFHAFFDPQDTLEYKSSTGASPPADWRTPDEQTFFNQFIGLRPVNYQVILYNDEPNRQDEVTDQFALYYRHYRVYAGTEPIAVGLADIELRRVGVNAEWKIVLWTDQRDTTATNIRTLGRRRLDAYSPF